MRAILDVSGCCGRYMARVHVRPSNTTVITLEAFAGSKAEARAAVLDLVRQMTFPGFDPDMITERAKR